MGGEFSEIRVTCGSREEADKIGAALIEQFLVACVQVSGPIESRYRWNGKVETATEWQLAAKTRTCLFDEVSALIRENHSYEVPEILEFAIEDYSAEYGKWLGEQIR